MSQDPIGDAAERSAQQIREIVEIVERKGKGVVPNHRRSLTISRGGTPMLHLEMVGDKWAISRMNRRGEWVNTGWKYSDRGLVTVLLYYAGATDIPGWEPRLARFLETASCLS
jgi:hypothetical protein